MLVVGTNFQCKYFLSDTCFVCALPSPNWTIYLWRSSNQASQRQLHNYHKNHNFENCFYHFIVYWLVFLPQETVKKRNHTNQCPIIPSETCGETNPARAQPRWPQIWSIILLPSARRRCAVCRQWGWILFNWSSLTSRPARSLDRRWLKMSLVCI